MKHTILTIGWDPNLINSILERIEERSELSFQFKHLVEVATKNKASTDTLPENLIPAFISKSIALTQEDRKFLESIEGDGVPTIRAMICGDPYLRYMSTELALAYAAKLGHEIEKTIKKLKPLIVLASSDRLISSMALAVCEKHQVQFSALAFTVIPDNRVWFLNKLTPNSLIPIKDVGISSQETEQLDAILKKFSKNNLNILAYKAPNNIGKALLNYTHLLKSKIIRTLKKDPLKPTIFSTLSFYTAFKLRLKRLINRISIWRINLLKAPPEGRYAYFPLHMSPESMIDTWAIFYQNQLQLLEQIALALPLEMKLVVKLHFSDPDNYSAKELSKITRIVDVHIADPGASSRELIENASLVFGITGTSSLEAALLGKPILNFGDTPYLNFPSSERARLPDQLHSQILELLSKPKPSDASIRNAFIRYSKRYLPGRINDWSYAISDEDVSRFKNCFERLVKEITEAP